MNEWWDSMSGWQQLFWAVALFSSLWQLFFFIALVIGGGDFDHGDADVGGDADFDTGEDVDGHGDAAHGVKILSVRAMVAFGVGFGWTGVLGLSNGWTLAAALFGGLAFGMVFLFAVYFIMRFLYAMQDPGGGLDYWNGVGKRGHAYFTIPGARKGEGQIEIMLQGRLITANAVTEHPDPIPPRAPVIVLSVEGENLFVVEPDTVRDHLMTEESAGI